MPAQGTLAEAENQLRAAAEAFESIGARFELGRVEMEFAAAAHRHGVGETAAMHLRTARSIFTTLEVPKYAARADALAEQFGVSLTA